MRLRARWATWTLCAICTIFIAGCDTEIATKSYAYEVTIVITGNTGSGMDVAVTDESAGTVLASDVGITALPATYNLEGQINFNDPRDVSVDIVANNLPSGSDYRLVVTYTESVFTDPQTTTVIDETRTNDLGAATALSLRQLITLPYQLPE